MKPYNAKCGAVQYKPSKRDVMRGAREGNIGFCLACGEIANCVEPDARKYIRASAVERLRCMAPKS